MDSEGQTAYVAMHAYVDVIQFLLEYGFDPERTDNNNYSVLRRAAKWGNSKECEFLLKRGALVNRKSRKTENISLSLIISETPWSITNRQAVQTVRVLLEYGGEVANKVQDKRILEIAAAKDDCKYVL